MRRPRRSAAAGGPGFRIRAAVERPLRLLGWSYLAAVVAATLFLWIAGDRWWPATVLLFSGRWVLLTPLAVLAPAALLLQRRLVLPLAAAAAIGLGPLAGLQLNAVPSLARAHEADLPLRVVSFNVAGGSRTARDLQPLLAEWRADLVAFQECGSALAEAVGGIPGWHAYATEGQCLLSRYPIEGAAIMDRTTLERIKVTTSIGGAGNVIRYTISTPRGDLSLTTLHLETPRKGFEALAGLDVGDMRANTTLRAIESRLARKWVDGAEGPRLVLGDFNMPVESRIYRESWSDLGNAFSRAGRGFGMTRYNGWIRVRIDHVLFSDDFRAERAWVDDYAGSDHRPMIAELTLRGR